MPKGTNQKLKLYYLAKILTELTDDEHSLTIKDIQNELLKYEVTADRKSLYDDIHALQVLGIEVLGEKSGNTYAYHVASKQFEIAELKLLVDAIQSSKFITEKKSNMLIKKLSGFASKYEAEQLRRQVVVSGRIKSMNESIFYNVDELHAAIANNRKISFEYLQWTLEKKLELKRKERYVVSPWALNWDDENYYLIAFDDESESIRHYRVDKMRSIDVLKEKRAGKDAFKEFNAATFAKKTFGMFGGEDTKVKIAFCNELIGVMIDRFGKDITIKDSHEKGWSETWVEISISDQFFGWFFALGESVKILEPEEVVLEYDRKIKTIMNLYR